VRQDVGDIASGIESVAAWCRPRDPEQNAQTESQGSKEASKKPEQLQQRSSLKVSSVETLQLQTFQHRSLEY
jgi:hypothetical protein